MTNGKIARLALELQYEIPDLDKLEIKEFRAKKKAIFKKENTIFKTRNKIYIKAPENASCIYCSSTDFVKNGKGYRKQKIVQRYHCKNCQRKFSFNVGFSRGNTSPDAIAQALQLYFTGESTRNIAAFLNMQGIKISHGGVFNWIKRYTKLMKVFLDQFTPHVSDSWRCDEIYLKIQGKPKYLFALMDDETRFILAYYVADSKKSQKANRLFQMAIAKAQKKPKIFTTDGLESYRKAFKEEFWSPIEPCEHVRGVYSQGTKWKNNLMERFNGTFRQRAKTFRCVKKMDSVTIHGFILYYNFIRVHSTLKCTPAQKAGIFIEDNKWITLIQNAAMEQR